MAEYPTGLEGLVNWLGIQFQLPEFPMPEYPIVIWKHTIQSTLWGVLYIMEGYFFSVVQD